jgi:hypothetical protein
MMIPDYKTLRAAHGLPRIASAPAPATLSICHGCAQSMQYRLFGGPRTTLRRNFKDITTDSDPQVRGNLSALYSTGSVNDMDALVGGLAEDRKFGSVGPLFHAFIVEQFTRTRAGDRWWYSTLLRWLP